MELNNSKIVESTQSSKLAESDFEENMFLGEEENESARLYQQQDKGNTIVPPPFQPRPIVPPLTQTNSGNSFQLGKMFSGRKKKLRSSETLRLSESKIAPAYL